MNLCIHNNVIGRLIFCPNEYDINDTIRDIKERIYLRNGVPVHQQILFYNDKKLENQKTLIESNINFNIRFDHIRVCLSLYLTHQRELVFQFANDFGTKINVLGNFTMANIKKLIELKTATPASQQYLYFKGEKLNDDKTVADYGFEEQAIIEVSGEFQIHALNFARKWITLDVQVLILLGISKIKFDLWKILKDNELKDGKTLSHYGICKGTKLDMFKKRIDFRGNKNVQIFVRKFDGRTMTLNIRNNETIKNVRIAIQHRLGIPVSDQRLISSGMQLENGNLEDYKITKMATLDLNGRLR